MNTSRDACGAGNGPCLTVPRGTRQETTEGPYSDTDWRTGLYGPQRKGPAHVRPCVKDGTHVISCPLSTRQLRSPPRAGARLSVPPVALLSFHTDGGHMPRKWGWPWGAQAPARHLPHRQPSRCLVTRSQSALISRLCQSRVLRDCGTLLCRTALGARLRHGNAHDVLFSANLLSNWQS